MYGISEIITTGFALFAMLFGAGNLIFPPILGYELGSNWLVAAFAFILTGVGIPLLGLISIAITGRSIHNFADKVSPLFSKLYAIALILSIGPLLALPRTGATAYEVTFFHAGYTSSALKYVYLGIYFGVALIFSLKSSEVIDRIGKILTPVLIVVLAIILTKGVFFNDLPIIEKTFELPFKKGFIEGYQTLDALAMIAFSGVVLTAIRNGRELTKKQEFSFLIKTGLIATFGLALVYAGLTYIGATFGNFDLAEGAQRTDLLVKISSTLLGKVGYVVLGICVAGACLTTAIGLIVSVAEYFSQLLKISYKKLVVVTTLWAYFIAIFGVNFIVVISVPILFFLYPMSIALIFLNLLKIENDKVYKGIVFVTGVIGLYEALGVAGVALPEQLAKIYNILPLSNLGLAWVLPALIVGFLCGINKKIAK